jgi:hypothetical protein
MIQPIDLGKAIEQFIQSLPSLPAPRRYASSIKSERKWTGIEPDILEATSRNPYVRSSIRGACESNRLATRIAASAGSCTR